MMKIFKQNATPDADIEVKASECYLALADEDLPPIDRKVWMDWLLEKPEHQKAFGKVDRLWQQLNHVGLVELPTAGELAADDYEGEAPLPLAARAPRKPFSGRFVPLAAIAASLVILVGASFFAGFWDQFSHYQKNFATGTAEVETINLPDGSKIMLAGDSLVTTDFSSKTRGLSLVHGQAFFEVAKDAKRPFVVHSGNGYTTAIGTKFDVNNIQGLITVTVAHGLVRVSSVGGQPAAALPSRPGSGAHEAAQSTLVGMGEQVSYSMAGDLEKVQEVNLDQALSWRQGYLTLTNEPLPRAIEQINRFSKRRIYYRRSDIQNLKVSGTVYFDRIDDWLKGLEQGYAVKIIQVGPEGVLLANKNS